MATYLLTDRQVEIVNEVFANSVLRERAARVDDFRIDHVDWIDDLSRLSENKSILIEDEVYRVSILFLPDVDHVGAAKQLEQCATVLEALRERYLDKSTRYVTYRLVDLSRDLGLSYDTAVTAIQYLLDIGFLWMAGLNTSNLNDRESAGIFAGESIIRLKKLPDFLEYARELRQSSGSIGLRVPVPDPLESKEDEGAEVALRPERVISAYLGKLNSDEFVEITSLAGLEYDLGLTTKESFSKITRLRAYIPRLNEALSSLPDRQRLAAVNHHVQRASEDSASREGVGRELPYVHRMAPWSG